MGKPGEWLHNQGPQQVTGNTCQPSTRVCAAGGRGSGGPSLTRTLLKRVLPSCEQKVLMLDFAVYNPPERCEHTAAVPTPAACGQLAPGGFNSLQVAIGSPDDPGAATARFIQQLSVYCGGTAARWSRPSSRRRWHTAAATSRQRPSTLWSASTRARTTAWACAHPSAKARDLS